MLKCFPEKRWYFRKNFEDYKMNSIYNHDKINSLFKNFEHNVIFGICFKL